MALSETNNKSLIILFMCFIPFLLVIMWTATFVKKTKSDGCNAENYECAAPVIGDASFKPITPPQEAQKQPSSQPSTNSKSSGINDDEKKALDTARKSNTNEPFVSGTTNLDATKCGSPLRISFPAVNSDATFEGMKITSIVSMVSILLVGIIFLFGRIVFFKKLKPQGRGEGAEATTHTIAIIICVLCLVSTIMISVFLGQKEKLYTSAAFHTSIIFVLALVMCIIKFNTPDSWPTLAIGSYSVLGLLLVLMIFGTLFIHTYQKENIEQGKYTHAINESISAIVPIFMIGYVIISILVGVGSIATKNSIPFGITQIISSILLLACISMYYKYKADCNNSNQICQNKIIVITTNEQTKQPVSICKPDTGMSITKKTIINMGIAISVLMGINHLAGGLALGLHKTSQ
jgi:hypothetical protein